MLQDVWTADIDVWKIKLYTLENGIKAILIHEESEPQVGITVSIRGGYSQDPDHLGGIANLAS